MPFGETHVVDERRSFVTEAQRSLRSFSGLCQRYGISRPTGYKWIQRLEREGPPVSYDRPQHPPAPRPRPQAPQTRPAVVSRRLCKREVGPRRG